MTTTIKSLTPANVIVLTQYAVELPAGTEINKTTLVLPGTAAEALVLLQNLKDHIALTKGGRSFENRAIVAVLNKARDYVTGGRYAKHVRES